MKSQFKSYDLNRVLASAAKRFEQKIQQDCQKRWINLGADPSNGQVCCYDFEDGVQMLLLSGAMPEDWEIVMTSEAESPFLLHFNVRGGVVFNYDGLGEPIPLEPLKSLMVSHPPGQSQSLSFSKGGNTTFVVLKLERHLYINHVGCLPEVVKKEVMNIFGGKTAVKEFQNSAFGIQGSAMVQHVLDDKEQGLIHSTFAESKAIALFSLQLRRWEEEIVKTPAKSTMLRTDDVEKIIMAKNLLVADLKNAPTIEVLSKKSGVNRQKLKQGFKKMFGVTVNGYLRNERMRMARHLLSSGSPIVRDVAAIVGYENPSYFARRFKEKYGLYPNEFLHTVQAANDEA